MKLAFRASRFGTKFIVCRGKGSRRTTVILGTRSGDDDDGVAPDVRRGLLIDFLFFFFSLSLESWTSPRSGFRFFFPCFFTFFIFRPRRRLSCDIHIHTHIYIYIYHSNIAFTRVKPESDLIDCRDVIPSFIAIIFFGRHATRMYDGNFERKGTRTRHSFPSFPKILPERMNFSLFFLDRR